MARLSEAEVLILTAKDAMTPPVAMTVWTAAAQRERRRSHRRYGGGNNSESEYRSRKLFHDISPSHAIVVNGDFFIAPANMRA
jgi:hypothetical protein